MLPSREEAFQNALIISIDFISGVSQKKFERLPVLGQTFYKYIHIYICTYLYFLISPFYEKFM